MIIKKSHFGNSRACEILSDILNEHGDRNISRYICSFFAEYNARNKELRDSDLSDKAYRYFRQIMFESFRSRIDENNNLPHKVKSVANNVLKYRYRTFIEQDM